VRVIPGVCFVTIVPTGDVVGNIAGVWDNDLSADVGVKVSKGDVERPQPAINKITMTHISNVENNCTGFIDTSLNKIADSLIQRQGFIYS
jgi:hypothetical protein